MLFENLVSAFMLILGVSGMIFVQGFTKANARIMPEVAFIIMIVLSAIVLIKNLVHARASVTPKASDQVSPEADDEAGVKRKKYWLMFAVKFAIILFFFVTFPRINYFIMAPLTIIAVALLSGVSWKKVIPTAVVVTAAIYGIFIVWLNVFV